jgi:hypothetical protein
MLLVNRMTMAPNRCMVCGCGNVPDGETGEVGPFIDLGIDYNWGDSGYLCLVCGGKIAAMSGWSTPDELKDLQRIIEKKDKEIHNLRAKMRLRNKRSQATTDRLNRLLEGSREAKRTRKTPTKAA